MYQKLVAWTATQASSLGKAVLHKTVLLTEASLLTHTTGTAVPRLAAFNPSGALSQQLPDDVVQDAAVLVVRLLNLQCSAGFTSQAPPKGSLPDSSAQRLHEA